MSFKKTSCSPEQFERICSGEKENATDEQIITALKEAQAWEFVSKDEKVLDKWVEQGGSNFSGGQKQGAYYREGLDETP